MSWENELKHSFRIQIHYYFGKRNAYDDFLGGPFVT